MRIQVRNNRKKEIDNETVIKITKFYLSKLIGEDTFNDIRTIQIVFKKLAYYRGGYLRTTRINDKYYYIAVNSNNTLVEQLSTLAHECVHVKQYALKELQQRTDYSGNRVRHIRTWKGQDYIRIAYSKRPWEVEARKFQDTLSKNILNRINKPKVITKPKFVEVAPVLNTTREIVISILNDGAILNGELVPRVLKGNKDRQKTLEVLKEVYALKQDGVIQEYNEDSIIWVRALTNQLK